MPNTEKREAPQAAPRPEESGAMVGGAYLFGLLVLLLSLGFIFVPMLRDDRRNKRILNEGVPAKARVTNITPTGSHHNEDPEVVISLEVTPAQGKPFLATVETFISPVYLPRFQPGFTVDVHFDPKKPEDVAVVVP